MLDSLQASLSPEQPALHHQHVVVETSTAIKIELITRVEDLRRRDADWLRLCEHPESHPALFAAVCAANVDLIRPHIAFVSRGATVVAMAIARIQFEPVPIKFGLKRLSTPRLRVVRMSFDGFIGDLTTETLQALCSAMSEPLLTGEADALFLDQVKTGSPAHRWASSPPPQLVRDYAPARETTHWVAGFPDGFAAFIATLPKGERQNQRTNRNKIEREFSGRVKIACYTAPVDFARIETETSAVASLTYQSVLGASFAEQFWAGPLFRSALEAGIARCHVLYIDGAPKAFWHGLLWQGTFHSCFMGYDPEFANFGLGRYLIQHGIDELCRDANATRLDFGVGHADYKRRLASESWAEVDRYIFARRPRPIAINLLRGAAGRMARQTDAALNALGIRERVKQFWFRRITKRPAQSPDA